METKDEPSSCLSTCLIWISGRHSRLSIRNQSRGLWNISNPNLSIWISMARALECIMIIALNYMSYLHVCLLCVQDGVDLSPVDVSDARLARPSHPRFLSSHRKSFAELSPPAEINSLSPALQNDERPLSITSPINGLTATELTFPSSFSAINPESRRAIFTLKTHAQSILLASASDGERWGRRWRWRRSRSQTECPPSLTARQSPHVSYIWAAEVNLAVFSRHVAVVDCSPHQRRCRSRDQDEKPEGEKADS